MDENKFEKEVRQKMEELKIQPSASVWENVEKRIQKKDPRKRFAWLYLSVLVGLLFGGYYYFNYKKSDANNHNYAQTETKDSAISKTSKKNEGEGILRKEDENAELKLAGNEEPLNQEGYQQLVKAPKIESRASLKKSSKNNQTKSFIEDEKLSVSSIIEIEGTAELENEMKVTTAHVSPNAISFNDTVQNLTAQISDAPVQKQMGEKKPERDSIQSKLTENSVVKQKNKWILGFNFSAGKTLISSGLLGLSKSERLADLSYNDPGNSNIPPSVPQYSISTKTRNDVAIITGVFAQKKISKNTSFSLGINYKYFSTLNEVGNRISPGNYLSYSSNASAPALKTYRNNFHFIEVPFALRIESLQDKKLPITWQVGIAISQLVSSNSLQYKQGTLYIDNSLLNKMQIGLDGGVSLNLFSKQKHPISIGPYFYYGASSIAAKGLYGNKHLGSIGIRTEVLFKNNK